MLLATLLIGGLTAYWFGLRPGAWAAAVTAVLMLVAAVVPTLAMPIHLLLAAAVLLVPLVGSRRERPPDAVRAARWVRTTIAQVFALSARTATRAKKKADDDRR